MLKLWQARYKCQLDPTVEEVKKLCNTCRRYAKSERVLFHYNGHGVPKPTANGEIWLFNRVCNSVQPPLFILFYHKLGAVLLWLVDLIILGLQLDCCCAVLLCDYLRDCHVFLTNSLIAELYTIYTLANQWPWFLVEDTINICFWLFCCRDDCQCIQWGSNSVLFIILYGNFVFMM